MGERRRVLVPDFVGEPVHVAIEAAAELGLVLVGADPDGPSLHALTWPGLFWVTAQWTQPGITVEWGSEVEVEVIEDGESRSDARADAGDPAPALSEHAAPEGDPDVVTIRSTDRAGSSAREQIDEDRAT
ncbi:PASTA domain-containing protein [Microbacterium sp. NPDC089698]|uniref:PASTA domain-containing protein n=1 Tax=Microbacterium sp. NPDC089698 TaxID=3364200 RepID=UPI0038171A21